MVKSKHKKRYRKSKKSRSSSKVHVQGVITVTAGGFGFVKPAEGDEDIFIPPKYVGSLMNGDTVEVELKNDKGERPPGKGPTGRVVKVISRGRENLVGELVSGHKIRPLNKRFGDEIEVSGSLNGAQRGDWLEVKLLHTDDIHDGDQSCAVNQNLGQSGSIQADLLAIMHEYDLPFPYTAEEDDEAADLKPVDIHREDHTRRFTMTLDPIDAKDFDDALSFSNGGKKGELEIGVHIADVAAWIRPGSCWDKEARRRAFTAYLPGKTLPMLPKTLTRMISLTTDGESLAHTLLITVDIKTGEITGSKRCYSRIQVDKRLNYNEVQEYIDGKQPEDWDDDLAKKVQGLVDLTRTMRERRKEDEQFLELAVPEIRILCNEERNEITGLAKKIQRESEQLVEECMLAANQEVAKEMIEKKIPGVYRVHPEPNEEKLEEFTGLCMATIGRAPGDLTTRYGCNTFLASLENDEKKPIVTNAFLRSLARAYYLESHQIHFGLGKMKYSHFTSPIRRYADTLVHQQLIAIELKEKLKSELDMKKVCSEISAKEKNNDEAYYAANDRLKLRYLDQQLENGEDNHHEAVIIKVNAAGMQVEIVDVGVYGFIPVENLDSSFFFDKKGGNYSSKKIDIVYQPGDVVYLRLDQIDFTQGTALFAISDKANDVS